MKRKNLESEVTPKRKRTSSETETTKSLKEFNVKKVMSKKQILQCISAICHMSQKRDKETTLSLLDDLAQPIFIQVTSVRVPKMPRRQLRM